MEKNTCLVLAVGDPLLTRQTLEKKLSQIFSTKTDENAVQRIFAKGADWAAVLEQARTYPFISEKQVFWIKQAELIGEKEIELLEKYFENPAPFSLFLFESESFQGKKKFLDWVLSEGGEAFIFETANPWGGGGKNKIDQVRTFIREKMKALKLNPTPGALKLLEESCGDHFLLLDNTIEKLSLLAPAGQITEKEVEDVADKIDDRTGFKLAEALASKNISEVLEIYFNLYEDNPYQSAELLGLLNWQMRRIYEAKSLIKKGASKNEIASKFKMNAYFLDRFIANVQKFDESKLRRTFGLLFETDEAIKTGKVAVGAAMESLLLRLCLS